MIFRKLILFFALTYIVCTVLIAILAYSILPDNSKNSNYQMPEIALLPMNSKVDIIQFKSDQTESWISIWLHGKSKQAEKRVVSNIQIIQDTLYYTKPFSGLREYVLVHQIERNNQSYVKQERFMLGTDRYGRDLLSRILLGLRYSILVGCLAVIVSVSIGVLIGLITGYFGGKLDRFFSLIMNTFWAIPTILLAFAIILAMGKGIFALFLAIGLTMWVDVARLVRGMVLSIKEQLFIQALTAMGFSKGKVIFQHILPQLLGPLMILVASNFSLAILLESGLSYLGLGLMPPTPTLGNIIQEQYGYAISGKAYLAWIPAVVVVLLILSFQILTSYLRDIWDVKYAQQI